jgi:acetyltransferase
MAAWTISLQKILNMGRSSKKPNVPPGQKTESAHDIFRRRIHPLDVFFSPRSVAVIGGTETPGSIGRTIVQNLLNYPLRKKIFPVNPKRPQIFGLKSYPKVTAIPEKIDLAVIATPAVTVPGIIGECVDAGVQGAIIISAGFKETGSGGAELERRILATARRGRLRVIGPNCLGVMAPVTGLNATFVGAMARPGNVGFVSQSGALCAAVLDWSLRENVGFSAFVSVGSMLDVGWGDLIDYLGDNPQTQSIVMYMESIGNARSFLSAAREVALTKPIIVIKVGHSEAAAKAAASHTGALTGSDEVLDTAFRRCGVLRVHELSELFAMAEVLAKQPRPKGPRLMILTNAGGPGVLATDELIAGGGELAALSKETLESFNRILPNHWSHNNPVDILGDAGPERYAKSLEIVTKDPGNDGFLVILAPQAIADPTLTAQQLKPYAKIDGKPILASWMGGDSILPGEAILNQAGIPTFRFPETAARAFNYMWRYNNDLRILYETPVFLPESDHSVLDKKQARRIIQAARSAGREILTEVESKQLLAAYGIPVVETRIAGRVAEAVKIADAMGYPVVLKLYSRTITHKTDVGGVQLNLANAAEVKAAYEAIHTAVKGKLGVKDFEGVTVQPMIRWNGYELIMGSSIDRDFGPVLLFGMGGQLVEVYKDKALGLPPLNTTLARRMMERTRIYTALRGVRRRQPVDLSALEQLLVRFSQITVEQRWIKELDINPLLAAPEGLVVLDARVILHPFKQKEAQLPRPSIRPYPAQYLKPWRMKNGVPVIIRPIRPEDELMMVKFHQTLSEQSVYFRYLHPIKLSRRTSHDQLMRMCFIDYDREIALVVECQNPETGGVEILAVGRLSRLHGLKEAEFSLLVRDSFQGRGLGTELLRRLVQIGREERLDRIIADIQPENHVMHHICKKLGFRLSSQIGELVMRAEIQLRRPGRPHKPS